MFKPLSLILVVAVAAAVSGAEPVPSADIKTLLSAIRDKRASNPDVQADFREEKATHLMAQPITSTGHVWFEAPNKFRREISGRSPSITVSDGKQLWIYYPNFKSVEHYSLGKHSPVDAAIAAINTALNLDDAERTFQIAGAKAGDRYDLQLSPRSAAMKRIFQRFDIELNSDLLVRRTEMLQPNGDRVVTTYSNQSRASIPATTFQFTPPAGTEVSNPLGK